jgi:hypothetical protein
MLYYNKKIDCHYFYNFIIKTIMDNSCDLLPMNTTPEAEIARLATCKCCSAHKNNKPTFLCQWIDLQKNHATSEITNKDKNGFRKCKCDCRHKARFICRKYYIS